MRFREELFVDGPGFGPPRISVAPMFLELVGRRKPLLGEEEISQTVNPVRLDPDEQEGTLSAAAEVHSGYQLMPMG